MLSTAGNEELPRDEESDEPLPTEQEMEESARAGAEASNRVYELLRELREATLKNIREFEEENE